MSIFSAMQAEIREVNEANGWYEGPERPFGDDIALLHSEVSEMYEAFRRWGMDDATPTPERIEQHHNIGSPHGFCNHGELQGQCPLMNNKPEGVGSEAADILIRLLDTCDRHGIDLSAEYDRKLAHNRTRGYRHGGKAV